MTTAPTAAPHTVEHTETTTVPASRGYRLVADVTRWPLLFDPCLHAEVLHRDAGSERIRLWALAGGEVRSWTSRREIQPERHRITFRQEESSPPLASMSGYWQFDENAAGGTRMVLGHDWAATDDAPTTEHWITQALDRNSTAEIAAVKAWAERTGRPDDLIFSFTDEIRIEASAADVYAFLARADLWPQRLPHVTGLDLTTTEASPHTAGAEVQTMEMDTRAADGSVHTTRSVRLCFAGERIVYKQTTPPVPLLGHGGEWRIVPDSTGVVVTARHSVALDPDALAGYFRAEITLEQARAKVRDVLGGNSRRTLEQARAHAERPVREAGA